MGWFVTDDTELCGSDQLQKVQCACEGTAKHCVKFDFLRLYHTSVQAELTLYVGVRVCVCVARPALSQTDTQQLFMTQ